MNCIVNYFFSKRSLWSSLLTALPEEEWHSRDDVYECKEASYVADVERDIILMEGQMISRLTKHLLEELLKNKISDDKLFKVSVCSQCHLLLYLHVTGSGKSPVAPHHAYMYILIYITAQTGVEE